MAKPKGSAPSSAPAPAPRESLLTTAQAAILLEIGPERVRQLVKSGHIEKRGKDQVPLVSAVRGYISFLKDEARRSSKSASASRVQDARARQIELKNAKEEAKLIEIEEHEQLFIECFGMVKSKLLGLPARVGGQDMALRREVETEINAVLNACADQFEKGTVAIKETGSAVEADAGDDA